MDDLIFILADEEVEEDRTCVECGEVITEYNVADVERDTDRDGWLCRECAPKKCPRCGEEYDSDEQFEHPASYWGDLDDRYKVCEHCQDEYEDKHQKLKDAAQTEADEWWDEGDWSI